MNAMTRNGSKWMVMCAAGVALVGVMATPASAQQLSEARIQELTAEAAKQAGTAMQKPRQAPAAQPGAPPVMGLTLGEAVKDALDHNLDIVVQRLNPEI